MAFHFHHQIRRRGSARHDRNMDTGGAGAAEETGALPRRGARGEDVIHEEPGAPGDGARPQLEGPLYVGPAGRSPRRPALRRGGPPAPQPSTLVGKVQPTGHVPGEESRLVVPPLPASSPVKRNGRHPIHHQAALPHRHRDPCGERPRQGCLPAELQPVYQIAHRPLVAGGDDHAIDADFLGPAALASGAGAGRLPATAATPGPISAQDRVETVSAEVGQRGRVATADPAGRRPYQIEQGGAETGEGVPEDLRAGRGHRRDPGSGARPKTFPGRRDRV